MSQAADYYENVDPANLAGAVAIAENQESASALEDVSQTGAVVTVTGVRAQRVLTMKAFVPSPDWIMVNVVAKGQGTHVAVGRLYGKARATERTVNEYQGKQLTSVKIEGIFESTSYLTGEITRSTVVYLPLAYAEQVEMALTVNPDTVIDIDIDLGLEATGKTIPYTWTVTSFVEGRAERALRAIRERRSTKVLAIR